MRSKTRFNRYWAKLRKKSSDDVPEHQNELTKHINQILHEIDVAAMQLSILVDALCAAIAILPDNPHVHRMTKQAFVISFSALGQNLSPEYHDFRWQYNAVIAVLQQTESICAMSKLQQIIEEGRVKRPDSSTQYAKLHPGVITNLQELLT